MSLSNYEAKFAEIRINVSGDRASPHKVAMLLAVMDAIQEDDIRENRIFFSKSLCRRFKQHFESLAGPRDQNNPHHPFFHLRGDGFWHHRAKPGMQRAYDRLTTASGPGVIHDHIQYAFLDNELFELMQNEFVRKYLKSTLLEALETQQRSRLLQHGNNWDWLECEEIVGDYLEMLAKHFRGESLNKTGHREALQKRLRDRSAGSIEFKHRNISAVMVEFGLPYLPGYRPAFNYQAQLKQAVLARLANRHELLAVLCREGDKAPAEPGLTNIDWSRFIDPTPPEALLNPDPPEREFLTRTTNFTEREARNRKLGRLGEELILQYEQHRLAAAGRADLAAEVEQVSETRGDGLGYDVRSFDPAYEKELFIEVKTTRSGKYQPFFITENERAFSQEYQNQYGLYRVYEFTSAPRVFVLPGFVEHHAGLLPESYRAVFAKPG